GAQSLLRAAEGAGRLVVSGQGLLAPGILATPGLRLSVSNPEHGLEPGNDSVHVAAADLTEASDEAPGCDGTDLERVGRGRLLKSVAGVRIEAHQPIAPLEPILPGGDRDDHPKCQNSDRVLADDHRRPDLPDLVADRRVEVDEPDFTAGHSHRELPPRR